MTQFTLAQLIAAYFIGAFWGMFIGALAVHYTARSIIRRKVGNDVDRHMAGIRTNLKQGG